MDKSAKVKNIVSVILTLLVVSAYLIPNLVDAVSVELKTDKSKYTNGNEIVTVNAAVDIEDGEKFPFLFLALIIDGPNGTVKNCHFDVNGNPISDCDNVVIMPNVSNNYMFGYLSGYGYSSMNGSSFVNMSADFGYGYGYGYSYGYEGFGGELSYVIKWNITADNASDGNYSTNLIAHAENGAVEKVYTKKEPVDFEIDKEIVGCFSDLMELPASCSVGEVISDTFGFSCREVTCSDGVSSTTALACEKPDTAITKTYFEMFATAKSGPGPVEACIGESTCVDSTGYSISPLYPICVGGAALPLSNATLNVTKVVINDNLGTKTVGDFPLNVNGTPITSGVAKSLQPGTYKVGEVTDSGYKTTISGDCASDGTIVIGENDSKSCIITNDDIAVNGTLTVVKVVVNDDNRTLNVSDFPLFVNGSSVTSGSLVSLKAGTYKVTETTNANYTATFSGDCGSNGIVVLAENQSKTCTITNNDTAIPAAVANETCLSKLASMPVTCKNGSVTQDVFSGSCRTVSCTDNGSFTTALACEKPDGTPIKTFFEMFAVGKGGPNRVEVCYADTCVDSIGYSISPAYPICFPVQQNDTNISNPVIMVTKIVVNNNGGNLSAADFPLNINGSAVTSGFEVFLAPGTYKVGETTNENYTQTISGDCSSTGTIVLAPGQNKTCTITNDDKDLSVKNATLNVTKIVINNNGKNLSVGNFPLFINGTPVTSGSSVSLLPGTYKLTETANPNYTAAYSGDCGSTGLITLAPNVSKTCTITNDDIPPPSNATNLSCANSVFQAPVTCTGGIITSDSNVAGCRQLVCLSGGNSVNVKACNKPDSGTKTFFEMYRQSASGIIPKLCLGATTCIQNNGYKKSPNFPICPNGTAPFCGDGVVNQASEECDGSAGVGPNQTCSAACKLQNVTGTNGTSVKLSIKPFFPIGTSYVFVCTATGFTPTLYDWNFGDGDTQTNSNNMNVWHTYTTAGAKTVKCTAKNAVTSKMATLGIVV
jgi:hypothetical protein